jgi:gluconokinase
VNPDPKASIAAIDIGTTSAKGLVVQANGIVTAVHQQFIKTSFPHPGFAEQDPDEIFSSVLQILKGIGSGQHLSGICFSAAMHSLMAVDESGIPLTNLMIWSDTRSTDQSNRLIEKKLAQQLYETTGTPVHPMSPLCKLLWLKENQREIYRAAFKFIPIKEYILFRLTGDFAIDHSVASATGLFDLTDRIWSVQALGLAGLTAERFSRIVAGNTSLKMTDGMARELGLTGVPLIVGASDGCLAQLGSHAMDNNEISITIGTSGAVRVASEKRKIDPNGKIFNYLLDEHTFICGGATNNGTALLSWYSRQFDPTAGEDPGDFVNQTTSVPAGCDGLLMIPHLLGERAPVYNPKVRGAFFGISIDHTKRHFQRALIEGICFQIRWITECVEALFDERETTLVSGGFARSEVWVQILCDVLGKPLTIRETHDASAVGAALFGFGALGVHSEFITPVARIFHPDERNHRIYTNGYQRFRALYSAVEKLG